MQLTDAFLQSGEDGFQELIRGISIGKLKTYQVYEGLKVRGRFHKLNAETLRNAVPRFLARLRDERDEEFARDLAQAVLVSHLELLTDVLGFLGIPNEGGFFNKELDSKSYLTDGWQDRVFQNFQGKYPRTLLLFYINHLAAELTDAAEPYAPPPSA